MIYCMGGLRGGIQLLIFEKKLILLGWGQRLGGKVIFDGKFKNRYWAIYFVVDIDMK